MDDFLLGIFQSELEYQCKFVLIGGHQVNTALERNSSIEVWFGLQGMLISASNASKLLWGAGRSPSERDALYEARRSLRESVGVDDDSPLNNRDVRNSFEHFDDRLDAWFGKSANHVYLGRNFGTPGGIVVDGQEPDDHFGHFDPSTGIVTFWDKAADLNPIAAEAKRILRALGDLKSGQ